MMKKRRGTLRLAMGLGLWLLGIGQGAAYEEASVLDGGTVTGTITLTGEVPSPKSFELRRAPDPVFCGALSDGLGYRLLREVAVGQAGRLQDVVVMIEGVRQANHLFGRRPGSKPTSASSCRSYRWCGTIIRSP